MCVCVCVLVKVARLIYSIYNIFSFILIFYCTKYLKIIIFFIYVALLKDTQSSEALTSNYYVKKIIVIKID